MTSALAAQTILEVNDASAIAEARRLALRRADFSEVESGNLALVATELATNIIKHARSGWIIFRSLARNGSPAVELIAVDRGPGIANLAQAMRDGFSTAGSPGSGLGAIKRLSNEFDVYSIPAKGTAVLARLWSRNETSKGAMRFGVVCLPMAGEEVSGDAWSVESLADRALCMVADGLGHGPDAARAAQAATAVAAEYRDRAPAEIIERAHGTLRSTRGAAVAVSVIEPGKKILRFCGVGNIGARIIDPQGVRHLVSLNGIVGQETRKITEFTYPWTAASTLIMHSDGLVSRWDLSAYPALLRRHEALIAAVLYRDCSRGRDDTSVLSARENSQAAEHTESL